MKPLWALGTALAFVCSGLSLSQEATDAYQKAQESRRQKNFEAALASFQKALELEPDSLRFGSEYRMTVIEAGAFEEGAAFLEDLCARNPEAAFAHLNLGFAIVDKIPAAGSITQVLLASKALMSFSRSLEIKVTWIGLYARGRSYLFWPKAFNRMPLALADLEKALEIQESQPRRSYHVRVFSALGDAYLKMGDIPKARSFWQTGLGIFPENENLKKRMAAKGDELEKLLEFEYDPNLPVDTDLKELWSQP